MIANVLWLSTGLAALIAGAELLTRGGTRLAWRLGIRPVLIGLTVVALGTSMPELAVGLWSSADGEGSLAVGNIVGANIMNMLLILGLSALLLPLSIEMQSLRFDLPMMTGAALVLLIVAWDLHVTRTEGLVMLVMGAVYIAVLVQISRNESRAVKAEFEREYGPRAMADVRPAPRGRVTLLNDLAWLMGGMAIVVVGAEWLVEGASGIARALGVTEAVIGLTIVALGTSSPELATTVVSTLRQERDIAIGNLLGSCVLNTLVILGATVVSVPGGIGVDPLLVRVDIPVMVLATIVCIPVFVTGRRVGRLEGLALLAAYLAYMAYLLAVRA